jgi:frataxin
MKKNVFVNLCKWNAHRNTLIISSNYFTKNLKVSSSPLNIPKSNYLIKLSLHTFSDKIEQNKLTLDRYLEETHKIFEHIFEKIDTLDLDLLDNIDLTEGVLNIKFKSNQSYVLNIQRPNLQIWLSSPISGPQRFEYDQDKDIWFNIRNSKNLLNILNEEFNKIIKDNNGKEISL